MPPHAGAAIGAPADQRRGATTLLRCGCGLNVPPTPARSSDACPDSRRSQTKRSCRAPLQPACSVRVQRETRLTQARKRPERLCARGLRRPRISATPPVRSGFNDRWPLRITCKWCGARELRESRKWRFVRLEDCPLPRAIDRLLDVREGSADVHVLPVVPPRGWYPRASRSPHRNHRAGSPQRR
jgi:hypothetical protein